MARQNHIPLRSCISCGTQAAKRDLQRIVASKDGDVKLDTSGEAHGRGAYICMSEYCTPQRLPRGRIRHALRMDIDNDQWDQLMISLGGLLAAFE